MARTQELWGELDRLYGQDARAWEEPRLHQGHDAASLTQRSQHQSRSGSRPSSRAIGIDDHHHAHANGQNGRIVPYGRSHANRSQQASVTGSQHFQVNRLRTSTHSGQYKRDSSLEHVSSRGDDDADEDDLLGGLHAVIDAGLLFLQGGYGLKS